MGPLSTAKTIREAREEAGLTSKSGSEKLRTDPGSAGGHEQTGRLVIQQTSVQSGSVGVLSKASATRLALSPSERRSDTHARKHVRVPVSRLRATASLHRPSARDVALAGRQRAPV